MKKSDLVLTRTFAAPPARVYSAWTDPRHLSAWWGPAGFSARLIDVQPRPGGPFRLDMIGPDGTVYGMFGTFHELEASKRIVFSSGALDAEGQPMFEVKHTVTFAAADGGKSTDVRLEGIVVRQGPGAAAALGGMRVGWGQTLDRLSDWTVQDRVISASRVYSAPRARVFELFTTPAHLAQWWGPNGFRLTTHRADFRTGGEWVFTMHGPDGRDYENHNRFLELTAPERVVFDHVSPPEHRVTVQFYEIAPALTAIHFQLVFTAAELRRQVVEKFKADVGLTQTLGRLEELLSRDDVSA